MADVSFERGEYRASRSAWDMVRTLCSGEAAVKAAGTTYLPDPCVTGTTGETLQEAAKVYQRYKDRALFVNIVGRTRSSLVNAVFRKAPRLTVPANLQYMGDDCDGAGVSIYQQSQAVLDEILATGRSGLLVDYPITGGAASVADTQAGLIRANIVRYDADQIINWQLTRIGGKSVLSRVVLSEEAEVTDGFETKCVPQRRELAMVDGRYTVTLWRQNEQKEWIAGETVLPTTANNMPWTEIPFVFVGALNNDACIDQAPLYDLACVNRKHYQLGADWYNALYYAGSPQPVISGLNVEWRDWLEKQGVVLGSRSPLALPQGGSFQYATVTADSAIQKELSDLVQQMVSLGARLIKPGEVSKTATQSAGEQEVSYSVVSLAAENVSDAYDAALLFAQKFVGGTGLCEYELNGDISSHVLDPQMLTSIIAAVQGGLVPKSDAIKFLQQTGLIDSEKTVEMVDEETSATGLNLSG